MSPADEEELGRLSALLESIDGTLPGGSPLREALVKAGIALGIAYIDGQRGRVEETYARLGNPLSAEERARLIEMGIDPDADEAPC